MEQIICGDCIQQTSILRRSIDNKEKEFKEGTNNRIIQEWAKGHNIYLVELGFMRFDVASCQPELIIKEGEYHISFPKIR